MFFKPWKKEEVGALQMLHGQYFDTNVTNNTTGEIRIINSHNNQCIHIIDIYEN